MSAFEQTAITNRVLWHIAVLCAVLAAVAAQPSHCGTCALRHGQYDNASCSGTRLDGMIRSIEHLTWLCSDSKVAPCEAAAAHWQPFARANAVTRGAHLRAPVLGTARALANVGCPHFEGLCTCYGFQYVASGALTRDEVCVGWATAAAAPAAAPARRYPDCNGDLGLPASRSPTKAPHDARRASGPGAVNCVKPSAAICATGPHNAVNSESLPLRLVTVTAQYAPGSCAPHGSDDGDFHRFHILARQPPIPNATLRNGSRLQPSSECASACSRGKPGPDVGNSSVTGGSSGSGTGVITVDCLTNPAVTVVILINVAVLFSIVLFFVTAVLARSHLLLRRGCHRNCSDSTSDAPCQVTDTVTALLPWLALPWTAASRAATAAAAAATVTPRSKRRASHQGRERSRRNAIFLAHAVLVLGSMSATMDATLGAAVAGDAPLLRGQLAQRELLGLPLGAPRGGESAMPTAWAFHPQRALPRRSLLSLTQFPLPLESRQWGTNSSDHACAVALAHNETEVLVAGHTLGELEGNIAQGGRDAVLSCLRASDQQVLWVRQWGSSSDDYGFAVATADTLALVAGHTAGELPGNVAAGAHDFALSCVDASSGDLLWQLQWGTATDDHAFGLALLAANSSDDAIAFVAGDTHGQLHGNIHHGSSDMAVTCLRVNASQGALEWQIQWGSAQADFATAVVLTAAGARIVVAGHTEGALPGFENLGGADFVLSCLLAADGQVLWRLQWGSSDHDRLFALAVNEEAALAVVAGETHGELPDNIAIGGADKPSAACAPAARGCWCGSGSGERAWMTRRVPQPCPATADWRWWQGTHPVHCKETRMLAR